MDQNAKRWLRGMIGAAISGGAGAVSSITIVSAIDGKDWGPGSGWHFILLVCGTFGGSAVVSLAKYLKQHPLPGEDVKEA